MILESKIQKKVCHRLEKNGWYVVKIIQSTKNGWPDLQALKNGKTIYIEVKSEKGKLSELQKYRHKELRKHGAHVFTIKNLKK